jgi:HEAT repeat protein
MANTKVLLAADERRQARVSHAKRVHGSYAGQVEFLIHQLAGPSQADRDRAGRLLTQMSCLIVPQLIEALNDPGLDDHAIDEIAAFLGDTGDESARQPLWDYYKTVKDDPDRSRLAILSLAKLGDPEILSFVRQELDTDHPEKVSSAITALKYLGELEDVSRLRAIHRTCLVFGESARGIRKEVVNAILAILDEAGEHTAARTMDQIRSSFADQALWKEISAYTKYST